MDSSKAATETRSRSSPPRELPETPTSLYQSCSMREKEFLEQAFLSDIDPKDRSALRKCILGSFLSNQSDPFASFAQSRKMWDWVQAWTQSVGRQNYNIKSLSYRFLDHWLSKGLFRDAILSWMETYEQTLSDSPEDQKLKLFLQYLRGMARMKSELEERLSTYFESLPPLDLSLRDPVDIFFTGTKILRPGLYFSCQCLNEDCFLKREKTFASLGAAGSFDVRLFAQTVRCSICFQPGLILGTVLADCRWKYAFSDSQGRLRESQQLVAVAQTDCDELLVDFPPNLRISICALTPEELSQVCSIRQSCVEDHFAARKRSRDAETESLSYWSVMEIRTATRNNWERIRALTARSRELDEEVEDWEKRLKTITETVTSFSESRRPNPTNE